MLVKSTIKMHYRPNKSFRQIKTTFVYNTLRINIDIYDTLILQYVVRKLCITL